MKIIPYSSAKVIFRDYYGIEPSEIELNTLRFLAPCFGVPFEQIVDGNHDSMIRQFFYQLECRQTISKLKNRENPNEDHDFMRFVCTKEGRQYFGI